MERGGKLTAKCYPRWGKTSKDLCWFLSVFFITFIALLVDSIVKVLGSCKVDRVGKLKA